MRTYLQISEMRANIILCWKHSNELSGYIRGERIFLDRWGIISFSRKLLLQGVILFDNAKQYYALALMHECMSEI
jgi:hypothetical protein